LPTTTGASRYSAAGSASVQDADDEQQVHGARDLAVDHEGQGERTERHEFALRDEDHPRDDEHQDQRQAQQRIDGAIEHAVLQQYQNDRRIHPLHTTARRVPIRQAGRQ
jgi:hypothetical protein